MTSPPTFASIQEHVSRLGDVGFWWPYVAEILERHDLADAGREPAAGFNATYPTFLYGDVVVKLFGYSRSWRASHAAERAAQALIATDPEIAAPSLLSTVGHNSKVIICAGSRRPGRAATSTHRQKRFRSRSIPSL